MTATPLPAALAEVLARTLAVLERRLARYRRKADARATKDGDRLDVADRSVEIAERDRNDFRDALPALTRLLAEQGGDALTHEQQAAKDAHYDKLVNDPNPSKLATFATRPAAGWVVDDAARVLDALDDAVCEFINTGANTHPDAGVHWLGFTRDQRIATVRAALTAAAPKDGRGEAMDGERADRCEHYAAKYEALLCEGLELFDSNDVETHSAGADDWVGRVREALDFTKPCSFAALANHGERAS